LAHLYLGRGAAAAVGVYSSGSAAGDRTSDPNSAAAIGKLLGVDAIIIGSITQFGVEKKGFSLGGIGGALGGIGGGKIGTQKGKAQVKLTARIVSVDTAEILASEKGDGNVSLNEQMIAEGLAWEYDGGTKKKDFEELREIRRRLGTLVE